MVKLLQIQQHIVRSSRFGGYGKKRKNVRMGMARKGGKSKGKKRKGRRKRVRMSTCMGRRRGR
jgi:hypothetical protein